AGGDRSDRPRDGQPGTHRRALRVHGLELALLRGRSADLPAVGRALGPLRAADGGRPGRAGDRPATKARGKPRPDALVADGRPHRRPQALGGGLAPPPRDRALPGPPLGGMMLVRSAARPRLLALIRRHLSAEDEGTTLLCRELREARRRGHLTPSELEA